MRADSFAGQVNTMAPAIAANCSGVKPFGNWMPPLQLELRPPPGPNSASVFPINIGYGVATP